MFTIVALSTIAVLSYKTIFRSTTREKSSEPVHFIAAKALPSSMVPSPYIVTAKPKPSQPLVTSPNETADQDEQGNIITVELVESTVYYPIYGSTFQEAREYAGTHGQEIGKYPDKLFVGVTSWNIDWTMPEVPAGKGCDFVSSRITVEIKITLPQWENQHEAGPEEIQKWNDYINDLQEHEGVHRQYAIDTANQIKSEFNKIPTPASCQYLRYEMSSIANRLKGELKAKNEAFDKEEGLDAEAIY